MWRHRNQNWWPNIIKTVDRFRGIRVDGKANRSKKTNLWGRGLRCSYLGAQGLVHTDDVLLEFGSRACTPFMPIDSKDDYLSGCRNVNHCQQQQSYSLGTTFTRTIILNLATYEMTPEFKPFTITFVAENDTYHTWFSGRFCNEVPPIDLERVHPQSFKWRSGNKRQTSHLFSQNLQSSRALRRKPSGTWMSNFNFHVDKNLVAE